MSPISQKLMVVSAGNVIRLLQCGAKALQLAGKHVGPLVVACAVWEKLEPSTQQESRKAKISVVDASADHLFEAVARGTGVTHQEQVSLLLAREQSLSCVVDERPVVDVAKKLGLEILSPSDIFVKLASSGHLSEAEATNLLKKLGQVRLAFASHGTPSPKGTGSSGKS